MDGKRYVTIDIAVKESHMTRGSVYRLAKLGKIETVKRDGTTYYEVPERERSSTRVSGELILR